MRLTLYGVTGIMHPAARALYEHFGRDLCGIVDASARDLQKINYVGPHSADCTYAFFHEPAYELWYNSFKRIPSWPEKKVLAQVLGKRVMDILHHRSVEEIRQMSLDQLASTASSYGCSRSTHMRKISSKEADKIFSYFRIPACEWHMLMNPHKREMETECDEALLNVAAGILAGRKTKDWQTTLEDSSVVMKLSQLFVHISEHDLQIPEVLGDFKDYTELCGYSIPFKHLVVPSTKPIDAAKLFTEIERAHLRT